ncbi:MAG: hypothetical protein ACRDV9_08810 [Acidimicrobiia bacterium]
MQTRRFLLPAIAVAAGLGIAGCSSHDMNNMTPEEKEMMPTSPSTPAGAPVPGDLPGGASGQA